MSEPALLRDTALWRRVSSPRIGSRLASHGAAASLLLGLASTVELLVRLHLVNNFLLPAPTSVLASIPWLVRQEGLGGRFLATAGEAASATGLAILVGTLTGYILHRWQLMRAAFIGWIVALAAAPLILLYPLFLIFFGRGVGAIVVMGAVAALMPVILKTHEGLSSTRPVLLAVASSLGAGPARLFWRVRVPAAMPAILSGIRLGLVYALTGVINVEYLTNFGGLGELIGDLADRYEMAGMYGAILFVMLVSAGLLAAMEGLQRWLSRS